MLGLSIPPSWLTIAAGGLTFILGFAYIIRTGTIVKDFRLVLIDHRRILTMALVCQGFFLCFIGAVVAYCAVAGQYNPIARTVSFSCAFMLLVIGLWTGSTAGRGEYAVFRIGQFVPAIAAMMIFVGNLLR